MHKASQAYPANISFSIEVFVDGTLSSDNDVIKEKIKKKTNTTYILFDLRKYFLFLLIIIYKNDMLFSL